MLYNVLLVSVTQQRESVISINRECPYYNYNWTSYRTSYWTLLTEPPSHPPTHPTLLDCHRALNWVPNWYNFLVAIYFMNGNVYVSVLLIPPSPSLAGSIHVFFMSASLFLTCKYVPQNHFPRFHIYASIYDICFSLSHLLHSV